MKSLEGDKKGQRNSVQISTKKDSPTKMGRNF